MIVSVHATLCMAVSNPSEGITLCISETPKHLAPVLSWTNPLLIGEDHAMNVTSM